MALPPEMPLWWSKLGLFFGPEKPTPDGVVENLRPFAPRQRLPDVMLGTVEEFERAGTAVCIGVRTVHMVQGVYVCRRRAEDAVFAPGYHVGTIKPSSFVGRVDAMIDPLVSQLIVFGALTSALAASAASIGVPMFVWKFKPKRS